MKIKFSVTDFYHFPTGTTIVRHESGGFHGVRLPNGEFLTLWLTFEVVPAPGEAENLGRHYRDLTPEEKEDREIEMSLEEPVTREAEQVGGDDDDDDALPETPPNA